MGAGLGLALAAAGHRVSLLVRTPRPAPNGVGLSVGARSWREAVGAASVVIVATPDAAIRSVADLLARADRAIGARHVVLHLSGLLDREALAPLGGSGAGLGSLHPLQAVADPAGATARFAGSYAAVEGDPSAVTVAIELARGVGMTPVEVAASAKPAYHAAAAITSNYAVTLVAVARRIAERAGIAPALAADMYLPLLHGTVGNLERLGPEGALTGAIRRGDAATVSAHIAALGGAERRLYVVLGFETVALARAAGLDEKAAESVEAELRRALPTDC